LMSGGEPLTQTGLIRLELKRGVGRALPSLTLFSANFDSSASSMVFHELSSTPGLEARSNCPSRISTCRLASRLSNESFFSTSEVVRLIVEMAEVVRPETCANV